MPRPAVRRVRPVRPMKPRPLAAPRTGRPASDPYAKAAERLSRPTTPDPFKRRGVDRA